MNPTSKLKFDVKGRLEIYLPSLFEVLEGNKIDWRTIERNFEKRFSVLSAKYEITQEPVRIEARYTILSPRH